MELGIAELLKSHPEMILFIIIGVGYLIGKIGFRSITLGSSIGVLFVGFFWPSWIQYLTDYRHTRVHLLYLLCGLPDRPQLFLHVPAGRNSLHTDRARHCVHRLWNGMAAGSFAASNLDTPRACLPAASPVLPLGVVTAQAKSNIPALGYVGVYAFANIILTIAGQIMMLL